MAVPNYDALLSVQELIDHYVSKIQEERGCCTLADVENFLKASLLIFCQQRSDPITDLIGESECFDDNVSWDTFLYRVNEMVPKKKYLKDLLVQDKIGAFESVIGTRKTKKAHRNTA